MNAAPDDNSRAIVGLEVLASGGGDCYKYAFMGRTFDYEPFTVEVPRCSSTPAELVVTSADGQTWKETFILEAKDPAWRCK